MQRSLPLHSLMLLLSLGILPSTASAYREYFTPEQKAQLEKIQTVLVEAIALTDQGSADSGSIAEVASRRSARWTTSSCRMVPSPRRRVSSQV
ncbi:MAG: hypothetical protein HC938_15830 [Nitrospira sp.]|nr:hypothetical protein [Nitrospira sp.]